MKTSRTATAAKTPPSSAPKFEIAPVAPVIKPDADKTPIKLIPGVNVFCVDCQAYNAKTRRCHFWPPHTNNSFTVMRGPIDDCKVEWCMQFKLRQ